jgi:hypothetical protein
MTLMTRAAALGGTISRFAHLDIGFTPLGRSARRAATKKDTDKDKDAPAEETAEEKAAREKAEADAKKKAEDEEAARKAKRAKKAKKNAAKSDDDDDDDEDDDDEDNKDDEPDDADEAEMERCEASGFGAAVDAAMAYGARLENSRCRKIFASEASTGRIAMACELAFGKESRNLSADAVIAILATTPVKTRIADHMSGVIPRIGSGDARAPATTEQKIAASWDHAVSGFMPAKR